MSLLTTLCLIRYDELRRTHSALQEDHSLISDKNLELKWRHVYMRNKQANFFDMVSVMEAKAYAKAAQFDQAAREGQETLRQIDIISEDSGNQHRRIMDLERSLHTMEQKAVKSRNAFQEVSNELDTTKTKAYAREKELLALVRQLKAQHADEIKAKDQEIHKLTQRAAFQKNEAAKALQAEEEAHAASKEAHAQAVLALRAQHSQEQRHTGSRLLFCLMKYKLLWDDYHVMEWRVAKVSP